MTLDAVTYEVCTRSEDLDELLDMVMDRDHGEALELVTMLHEIAKLYVADQMPKIETVADFGFEPDQSLEVVFSGRNVRAAKNLFKHLRMHVDEDGIPL